MGEDGPKSSEIPPPLSPSTLRRVVSGNNVEDGIASLKNLGSWLGLTQSSAKDQDSPGNCQTLIYFIVGGMTCSEARELQALARSKQFNTRNSPSREVIVGTTELSTPMRVLDRLLIPERQHDTGDTTSGLEGGGERERLRRRPMRARVTISMEEGIRMGLKGLVVRLKKSTSRGSGGSRKQRERECARSLAPD